MHKFAANVFLVSLAVAATTRVGPEKFENPRFLSIPSESTLKRSILALEQPPQTASTIDKVDTLTPKDLPLLQGMKNDVKFDFGLLLKEIKACRKSFSYMNDRKFSFKLYSALLKELTKAPDEPSIRTFCNISEGLVGGLKNTLHKLDVFQADLPSSTEFPNEMQNSQQTQDPEKIYSQRNFVRVEVENNLNLNLGDEWIPLEPKVNHMSHIYLGRSMFPLMTEESRILDRYHTLPGPITTKRTHVSDEGNDNLKLPRTAEKVHQLLLPIRWHVQAKRKALRVERSLNEEEWPSSWSSSSTELVSRPTIRTTTTPKPEQSTTTPKPEQSTTVTEGAPKKPTTKKPVKKARRPYSSMLEYLLNSWKDELAKITKSTLFD